MASKLTFSTTEQSVAGHTCEGGMRVNVSRQTHTRGVLVSRALVHLQRGGTTASAMHPRLCLKIAPRAENSCA